MSAPVISEAHRAARLLGTIAFADTGAANSRIWIYSTVQPAFGGAPGGSPLVEIVLAKPCGAVVDGSLVLHQADAGGDLIAANGSVVWGRWVNGDDAVVADADASVSGGGGFFQIGGTDGTTLRAGGRALLGNTEIT